MTTCQCDGCNLLRAERDDLARSALEEHQALVAERERCAEYAAAIDRLQQLLIIGRLALERERERSAKLAAENDQLRATMRAGRMPGSET